MEGMSRENVHAKVDEIFDDLAKLSEPTPILCRLLLQVNEEKDHSITGVILASRSTRFPFITWGVSPYGAGLHSGHYDMSDGQAIYDWTTRTKRGW